VAAPDFVASNLYVETVAAPRAVRGAVSRDFFRAVMIAAESAAGFAVCIIGYAAACALAALPAAGSSLLLPARNSMPLGAAFGLILVFLLHREDAYRKSSGLLRVRETERAIRVPAQALFLLLAIRLLLGLAVSWRESLAALFTIPVLLILERHCFASIAGKLCGNPEGLARRAVLYGRGDLQRSVASTLLQSPRLGFDLVAVVDGAPACTDRSILEMGYRGRRPIPLDRRTLSASLLKAYRCDMLLLAAPDFSAGDLAAATRAAHLAGSDVAYLCDSERTDRPFTETIDADGILFASSREPGDPWLYNLAKRIADVVVSSVLIALLAPFFALISILIRLDSPGPSLFAQKRVGRNGELFDMFKFRSMFVNAPRYARSPTSSHDPRITRAGRLLRRMSLDELPQPFNVLTGTMSLTGPRPEMPFVVERYDSRQRLRLRVKPGITGLWQLSADRAFPIHQNIEYDLYYIRNRTLSMDAAILLHTLIFALCGGI